MNKEEIEELKDFTIDLTDIDELALGLEVCSKKSNMVIQEFADIIIQLQQENKQLKKIKGKNQRTEDVLRQILKYCNYLHNDCKYRLNDGHIRKIRKIIRDYFGEEDKE